MRTRELGRTGVRLPVVGQGTWNLERDPEAGVRALVRGFELGLSHVDTAEMYGGGRVEEVVGQALASWPGEVFVTSKVLPSNASRAGTIAACERSLARLGRERLDLYLLHWPGEHPFEETLAGFEALEAAGKIRFFGVSNFDARELDEACRLAGAGRIACDQVLYHLTERAVEHRLLARCEALGASLVAYSPLGSEGGSEGLGPGFPASDSNGGKVLARIARARGATPQQVALAFLLRDQGVLVIPKAERLAHVEANARAGELVLEAEEQAALEAAFPLGPEPRSLPTI